MRFAFFLLALGLLPVFVFSVAPELSLYVNDEENLCGAYAQGGSIGVATGWRAFSDKELLSHRDACPYLHFGSGDEGMALIKSCCQQLGYNFVEGVPSSGAIWSNESLARMAADFIFYALLISWLSILVAFLKNGFTFSRLLSFPLFKLVLFAVAALTALVFLSRYIGLFEFAGVPLIFRVSTFINPVFVFFSLVASWIFGGVLIRHYILSFRRTLVLGGLVCVLAFAWLELVQFVSFI